MNLRLASALAALLVLTGCQTMETSKPVTATGPVMATPPGVGLKLTRGTRNAAGNNIPGPLAYTNAAGKLLYIYEKDVVAGASSCDAACLESYTPATSPKPLIDKDQWSTFERSPGVWQLAFKGNPLYLAKEDKESATYARCPVPTRTGGAVEAFPAPWCVALFQPAGGMKLPDGFAVQEIANASGQGLVDSDGFTLYAFKGDVTRDGQSCITAACKVEWKPVAAPALAVPVGDFSVVRRSDSSLQWAFKGAGLYTHSGDLAPGDATGIGADPRWTQVLLASYFTPAGIKIGMAPGFGTMFTDDAGMTLYAQNRGARGRGPSRPVPVVDCDEACLKVWHPFKAPEDAQGTGYWTVIKAPDGSRQWAYRGQGLFFYGLDKAPGDLKGEYIYSYYKTDPTGKITNIANVRSPTDVIVSWRPAFPY